MKRIMLLAAVAALMLALTAGPVLAADQTPDRAGQPEGSCPSGGGWVEKEKEAPPGSEGNFNDFNESPEFCFNELENSPEAQKEHFGIDPIEILIEDNTQFGGHRSGELKK
jgi:hypothetical protein